MTLPADLFPDAPGGKDHLTSQAVQKHSAVDSKFYISQSKAISGTGLYDPVVSFPLTAQVTSGFVPQELDWSRLVENFRLRNLSHILCLSRSLKLHRLPMRIALSVSLMLS